MHVDPKQDLPLVVMVGFLVVAAAVLTLLFLY